MYRIMRGYIVNLNRISFIEDRQSSLKLTYKDDVAGRHGAAKSNQSMKNINANYSYIRMLVDANKYIKSYLRIFFYAIQFLDGGNCDFDVTGARKKIDYQ